MRFKNQQYNRVNDLISNKEIFNGDTGGGVFRRKPYSFILQDSTNNLYVHSRESICIYFSMNKNEMKQTGIRIFHYDNLYDFAMELITKSHGDLSY